MKYSRQGQVSVLQELGSQRMGHTKTRHRSTLMWYANQCLRAVSFGLMVIVLGSWIELHFTPPVKDSHTLVTDLIILMKDRFAVALP